MTRRGRGAAYFFPPVLGLHTHQTFTLCPRCRCPPFMPPLGPWRVGAASASPGSPAPGSCGRLPADTSAAWHAEGATKSPRHTALPTPLSPVPAGQALPPACLPWLLQENAARCEPRFLFQWSLVSVLVKPRWLSPPFPIPWEILVSRPGPGGGHCTAPHLFLQPFLQRSLP